MKMSERAMICHVVLLLALTSVSATVRKLKSINDLKTINFGQSVPEHGLRLLYWFAGTVEINNNCIWLTFDPNNRDYGSHHYGNYERLLDPLPRGHQYYTVGNIYQDSSVELPSYVVNYQTYGNTERNMARIIIRVMRSNGGWQPHRIDQVYITQHFETSVYEGTRYNPQHTYEISTNLLREIREFYMVDNQRSLTQLRAQYPGQIDDFNLNDIRKKWGDLVGLGLLLLIVIQKGHYSNQLNYRPQYRQSHGNADTSVNCFIIVLIVLIVLLYLLNLSQTARRW